MSKALDAYRSDEDGMELSEHETDIDDRFIVRRSSTRSRPSSTPFMDHERQTTGRKVPGEITRKQSKPENKHQNTRTKEVAKTKRVAKGATEGATAVHEKDRLIVHSSGSDNWETISNESSVIIPTAKRKVPRCSSIIYLCVGVIMMILIVGIMAVCLTYVIAEHRYKQQETEKYITLPTDTIYNMSVDSSKYSEITFSFKHTTDASWTTVDFKLQTSKSEIKKRSQSYALDHHCNVYHTSLEWHDNPCAIARYWPAANHTHHKLHDPTGSLSCSKTNESKIFVAWEWFELKDKHNDIYHNDIYTQFKCKEENNTKCETEINVERFLKNRNKNDTLLIRFCPTNQVDNVTYKLDFTEHYTEISTYYDQYTIGSNRENRISVTVPLSTDNKYISIHTKLPTSQAHYLALIELKMKYTVRNTSDITHTKYIMDGAITVTVASIILCFLHIFNFCMHMCIKRSK